MDETHEKKNEFLITKIRVFRFPFSVFRFSFSVFRFPFSVIRGVRRFLWLWAVGCGLWVRCCQGLQGTTHTHDTTLRVMTAEELPFFLRENIINITCPTAMPELPLPGNKIDVSGAAGRLYTTLEQENYPSQ